MPDSIADGSYLYIFNCIYIIRKLKIFEVKLEVELEVGK